VAHFDQIRPSAARRIAVYGAALLTVATATGAAVTVYNFTRMEAYASLLLCAILFTAWFGGAGPGLVAVALSLFTFDYFLIPHNHGLATGPQDILRLLFFAVVALLIVWIIAVLKRTSNSLRRAHDDLKANVAQLEALNRSLQIENAERVRAEQTIQQAERERQVTIDTIPAIVARYRHDGQLDFVNQTWRTYTGLSQEDMAGHRWGHAIHPEDLPLAEAAWRAHLPAGEPFQIEHRMRRVDGEYRWHLVSRVPLRDENGDVISWYGVAHDIQDRKQAERALRRSEAYLAEAQRLSHTGSFSWKIRGSDDFLSWKDRRADHYWSKETYLIMGVDETVTPTIELTMQRVHPDDRTLVRQELNRALQGERDYDYEHRLLLPDGTVKYVHVRGHRHEYEAGEAELVGALMDITAEKKAREALQNAQAELAHITRVTTLGEMSASIAHELNQPLAAINSNAEATLRWLGRDLPDLDEARAAADRIVRNAQRAGDVIRRVREFAKKADLQMTETNLNEVVEEAITLVDHEAVRHGVTIQFNLASGLPPVRGDRIQLQQVVVNLAVNGMEAMAGIRNRQRVLTVRTQQHLSDRAVVMVEDTGVGIELDNLGRIFNAFHTTKPHGLGMGLSICRSIVEAHGGELWASPNVKAGMTFQFVIPVCAHGSGP
jgi:PAS domain S-box-containing protein